MRFSDGRLSTEKLLKATDEELSEMLIEIYGVGKVSLKSAASSTESLRNVYPVTLVDW